MSKGNPGTLQRGRSGKRSERKKLANDGYVFDGRFPTPPGVTRWVSVSGPDTGAIAVTPHNTVTVGRATRRAIRAAVRDHPDLRDALLGDLTDSWGKREPAA